MSPLPAPDPAVRTVVRPHPTIDRTTDMKRAFDLVLASIALALAAPILLVAAIGIRLSSPGPVLFCSKRVGRGGAAFTMYKLRTMHVGSSGSAITAWRDPRVFPFGFLLRQCKIDELPQLVNVLRGDMSIVGPRPEHPAIVAEHYTPVHHATLAARPGLTSPGSIYSYTHGEQGLGVDGTERDYVEHLLPMKIALDLVYLRRMSVGYDCAVIVRTVYVIVGSMLGRRDFAPPPELAEAKLVLSAGLATAGAPAREDGVAGNTLTQLDGAPGLWPRAASR